MVEDFGKTWLDFVEWLKNNSSKFGLEASNIHDAHPLNGKALPLPYVAVFALPDSDDESIPDYDGYSGMLFTVFVAAKPAGDLSQSVRASVELTNSVRTIILTQYPGAIRRHTRPQPEALHNNAAIMSFELLTICSV